MEIFVGTFSEEDLKNKKDKKMITEKQKETGLKYIKNTITKDNSKPVMKVWLTDKP